MFSDDFSLISEQLLHQTNLTDKTNDLKQENDITTVSDLKTNRFKFPHGQVKKQTQIIPEGKEVIWGINKV